MTRLTLGLGKMAGNKSLLTASRDTTAPQTIIIWSTHPSEQPTQKKADMAGGKVDGHEVIRSGRWPHKRPGTEGGGFPRLREPTLDNPNAMVRNLESLTGGVLSRSCIRVKGCMPRLYHGRATE